jgi:hypothetical protein
VSLQLATMLNLLRSTTGSGLFAVSLFWTPMPALAGSSLCLDSEAIYFSCVARGAIVSLCASPDLSRESGALQYRYGKSHRKIELKYPDHPAHPSKSFKQYSGSGTKVSYVALGFQVGDYAYSVFQTRSVFGYNGAGIIVNKSGKRISEAICEPKSIVSTPFMDTLPGLGIPEGDVDLNGPEFGL